MVYSFYFLCFGSRRNECNSIWGDKGGEVRSLLLARKISLSWNFIYLFSHFFCDGLFFLFSACWLQRNERNSLWENKGGERSEVYCLLGRYLCHGILFICSHITFPMVILFNFCLLAPEGMNLLYTMIAGDII